MTPDEWPFHPFMPCPACDGSGRVGTEPWLARMRSPTVVDQSGCWLIGSVNNYRRYNISRLSLDSHIVGFLVSRGSLPSGMVCHKCDRQNCWRPEHLYDGTALENNRDRRSRYMTYGRSGTANHFSKLTDGQVAAIQTARAESGGALGRQCAMVLAEHFGVSLQTVYRAAVGRSYREDTRQTPAPQQHWSTRGVVHRKGLQDGDFRVLRKAMRAK